MFSSVCTRIFLLLVTFGFCLGDFQRSCVYIGKVEGATGLTTFSELENQASLAENLNLIKTFDSGQAVVNDENVEVRFVKSNNRFFAVEKIKVALSNILYSFQEYFVDGLCDLKDRDNEVNNYFLNTHCIVKINYCVYDNYHIYVVGESVEGGMTSPEISTWYKGQDIKVKLEILKNFALALEHFHKNGYYHNELSPAVMYLKDKNDKSVMIRYREVTELNLTPKKFLYFPSYSLLVVPFSNGNTGVKADIYNLAMSFVLMESSNDKITSQIDQKCLSIEYSLNCHKTLIANAQKILEDAKLSELSPLITQSINFIPSSRLSSMADFRLEIQKILEKLNKDQSSENLIV